MGVSARHTIAAAVVTGTALLAGCGGGGSTTESEGPPVVQSPRGTLLSAQRVGTFTRADADAYLAAHPDEVDLVGTAPSCDVDIYQLTYATRGPAGEYVVDSAGLQVPTGCTGPYAMILRNHGTTILRDSTTADPDSVKVSAPYFSSQGYIVVTPDYSGYGLSTLDYHPYQVAENGAVVTIDAVRAARQWLASASVPQSGKFFIFGSSQGGGVTMATQRAMERDYASEFTITATVPTSGSYDLETSMIDNLSGPPETDPPAVSKATLLVTAYQRAYGDIYASTATVFQTPWDGTVTGLLPGTLGPFALVDAGLLPTMLKGSGGLFTESWVDDFMTNASNPMRVRLRQNGLISWTPASPMTLCGSSLDPAVSFQNTLTAAASFASRGVDVPVVDVEADPEYDSFIRSRTHGKDAVDAEGYHGEVVQTACQSYAKLHVFDVLR